MLGKQQLKTCKNSHVIISREKKADESCQQIIILKKTRVGNVVGIGKIVVASNLSGKLMKIEKSRLSKPSLVCLLLTIMQ